MNSLRPIFLFILILLSLNHCSLFRTIERPTKVLNLSGFDPSQVKVHWIGHATLLIQVYDKWILTDPNFSDSIGLIVKRHIGTPISLGDVPELDCVLISHTHFDHLDQNTLEGLKVKGKVLVPKGAGVYVPNLHEAKKVEMEPWQEVDSNQIKITAVPARHFGGRWLVDNLWDHDPYTGYVIEYKGITLYFAGDTGYQKAQFKEIGKKFQIDIAFLPVGPSKGPNNPVHINPIESVDTFLDLGAKKMIPMHYGTFYRTMESELETIQEALAPLGNKAEILSIGDTYELKK
ncbi:MBL fold metallo-hydrolase [Leptospira ognonensis]|uniref:MBL fold metallo-hydrolase n=1 Tax=Leptospira ognonensis TaxID=2484945 RepID=A0A4R9KDM7_9LEPT|nr:MBL fold metallo-hydrolase [Leptospira ognonensis]TGL63939.1 MBL fold metallo-hydrolase [Leptospira ognonensis]